MAMIMRGLTVLGLMFGLSLGGIDRVAEQLSARIQTMEQAQARLCAEAGLCDTNPLQQMIQKMTMAQVRLANMGAAKEANGPNGPGEPNGPNGPGEPNGPNGTGEAAGPQEPNGLRDPYQCGPCEGEECGPCEPYGPYGPFGPENPDAPGEPAGPVGPVGPDGECPGNCAANDPAFNGGDNENGNNGGGNGGGNGGK